MQGHSKASYDIPSQRSASCPAGAGVGAGAACVSGGDLVTGRGWRGGAWVLPEGRGNFGDETEPRDWTAREYDVGARVMATCSFGSFAASAAQARLSARAIAALKLN